MVYEHLSKCFIREDPSSGLSNLFQVVANVVHGDILRSRALMLRANGLLAMAKDIGGLRSNVVGEIFLRLINHSIILQLQRLFQEHLSPH